MSGFREAVRRNHNAEIVICPKCGDCDLRGSASPTIEREQDGSLTCKTCSHNWRPQPQ
jgi:hypothetical protein